MTRELSDREKIQQLERAVFARSESKRSIGLWCFITGFLAGGLFVYVLGVL